MHSRWQEGLLPQLLRGSRGGGGGGGGGLEEGGERQKGERWIVLDGPLKETQLETLLTALNPGDLLRLSNGRGIPIKPKHKFILEVCKCTCITMYTAYILITYVHTCTCTCYMYCVMAPPPNSNCMNNNYFIE